MQKDYAALEALVEAYILDLSLLDKLFSFFRAEHQSLHTKMAQHALVRSQGPRVQKWAFQQLIASESDQEKKLEYYMERALEKGTPDHIRKLKDEAGECWSAVVKKLEKRIKKAGNLPLLFHLYVVKDDSHSAIELLNRIEDTQILLRHAKFIWSADSELFRCRLRRDIVGHLEKYIGTQSGVYIIKVLRQLNASGLGGVKEDLLKLIFRDFSERKHLIKLLKDEF